MSNPLTSVSNTTNIPATRRRLCLWAFSVLTVVGLVLAQHQFPDWAFWPKFAGTLETSTVLAIFFSAMVCEYIDSALGMGYGTTLTPLLLLAGFQPLQVVPCVLFSELLTGLAAGVMHQRDGNMDLINDRRVRHTTLLLTALSAVGALAAVTLALKVPKLWLNGIIAVIILSVGVLILATVNRQLPYRKRNILAIGGIAAFNKGLSGGGYGPLTTAGQVFSGISAKQAVGITSVAESVTCLVGFVAYLVMHGAIDWQLATPLALGALISVPLATMTVRVLPEKIMRASVGSLTCILGVLMVVKLMG